jgi:hypothetical protein
VKVRDFLRVARAHQPEESLRAFMDPLADAISCATKWLKSSLERLSEKDVSDALSVDLAGIRRLARALGPFTAPRLQPEGRGDLRQG